MRSFSIVSGRHAWQLGGWERNRHSKDYGTCSKGLARSPSVNCWSRPPPYARSEERRTVRILSTHTPNHYDRSFHRLVCACSQTPTSFNGACNGISFLFVIYRRSYHCQTCPNLTSCRGSAAHDAATQPERSLRLPVAISLPLLPPRYFTVRAKPHYAPLASSG